MKIFKNRVLKVVVNFIFLSLEIISIPLFYQEKRPRHQLVYCVWEKLHPPARCSTKLEKKKHFCSCITDLTPVNARKRKCVTSRGWGKKQHQYSTVHSRTVVHGWLSVDAWCESTSHAVSKPLCRMRMSSGLRFQRQACHCNTHSHDRTASAMQET